MKKSHLHQLREHHDSVGTRLHVAIIMDGNGRWATARGLPRVAGHRRGAIAVRRTVEAAPKLGVGTLTLYAFSSDNWQRPPAEVATLMQLFEEYLDKETPECVENGVRINVIGRRDRLPEVVRRAIEAAETATAGGQNLMLRVAVDYSSRDAIVRVARSCASHEALPEKFLYEKLSSEEFLDEEFLRREFSRQLAEAIHSTTGAPEVDLLIRTGGEQRLSDFLLWECAYAELYFTKRMWPDFDAADLEAALSEFHARERRFGAAPAAVAG